MITQLEMITSAIPEGRGMAVMLDSRKVMLWVVESGDVVRFLVARVSMS